MLTVSNTWSGSAASPLFSYSSASRSCRNCSVKSGAPKFIRGRGSWVAGQSASALCVHKHATPQSLQFCCCGVPGGLTRKPHSPAVPQLNLKTLWCWPAEGPNGCWYCSLSLRSPSSHLPCTTACLYNYIYASCQLHEQQVRPTAQACFLYRIARQWNSAPRTSPEEAAHARHGLGGPTA